MIRVWFWRRIISKSRKMKNPEKGEIPENHRIQSNEGNRQNERITQVADSSPQSLYFITFPVSVRALNFFVIFFRIFGKIYLKLIFFLPISLPCESWVILPNSIFYEKSLIEHREWTVQADLLSILSFFLSCLPLSWVVLAFIVEKYYWPWTQHFFAWIRSVTTRKLFG